MSVLSLQNGPERVTEERIPPDHFLMLPCDMQRKILEQKQYQGYSLLVHRDIPCVFTLEPKGLEIRLEAGLRLEVLEELFHEVRTGIGKAILAVCRNLPCDRMFAYTPYEMYRESLWSDWTTAGKANDRSTWEAVRWMGDIVLKIKGKPDAGFKPEPLRRLEIPKPDGGTRVLSLPTVVDRTVAKAAVVTLGPMFEEIFLPSSTGCRTDRNRFDALAALHNAYPGGPGKIVLCADVKKAFDNVDHEALLGVISRYVRNSHVRELLRRFIHRREFIRRGKGLAQGCPLSPLLLNVLLHDALDVPLSRIIGDKLTYVRYVDDLCVFGFTNEAEARNVADEAQGLLARVGLELHAAPPKTQIADLATRALEMDGGMQELEDAQMEYSIDRYLGVGMRGTVDNRLEFFLPSNWRECLRVMIVEAEATITRRQRVDSINGHAHIRQAVMSWVRAFAPVWSEGASGDGVTADIIELSRRNAVHCDQLSESLVNDTMEGAVAGWKRMCREMAS